MLTIENINKLANMQDQYISVKAVHATSNDTYEIHFKHTSVSGWLFTYVLHRDMNNGIKYVGTLRYDNGNGGLGSHREDCLNTRLKRMDMFLEFLDVLIIEWKAKHHIS